MKSTSRRDRQRDDIIAAYQQGSRERASTLAAEHLLEFPDEPDVVEAVRADAAAAAVKGTSPASPAVPRESDLLSPRTTATSAPRQNHASESEHARNRNPNTRQQVAHPEEHNSDLNS